MNIWVELKNINVFRIKDMGENFNAFYLSVYLDYTYAHTLTSSGNQWHTLSLL